MITFGIIGNPLSHSLSPQFFTQRFSQLAMKNYEYKLFELPSIASFIPLITNNDIKGLNITSPYKEAIIPFLNEIDDIAQQIGSVNVVKMSVKDTNRWIKGYNTDVAAFEQSLLENWELPNQALILGTGGAAKTAAFVLDRLKISYQFVSRNNKRGILYDELTHSLIEEYRLIINATPVGMTGFTAQQLPILYEAVGANHFFFDMIYNPQKTNFLQEAQKKGAKIKNGLRMFQLQAEQSWQLFFGNLKQNN